MGYSELLMLLISSEIRKCENSLQLCTERLKHSTAETGRQMYFGLEHVQLLDSKICLQMTRYQPPTVTQ